MNNGFDLEQVKHYAQSDGGKYTGDWKDDIIQGLASQLYSHMSIKANNNRELVRVGNRITAVVKEFVTTRLNSQNQEFYAKDLVDYVDSRVPKVAPNSATRVMQNARKQGLLNYQLLSRSKSHYKALSV